MEISYVAKAEEITELIAKINEAKKNMTGNCLIIGRCLDEIERKKLYNSYSTTTKTFEDLLDELRIARSTGYHYMNIWRKFGEYLLSNRLDISTKRLIKLLPVAKEENKAELLDKANVL